MSVFTELAMNTVTLQDYAKQYHECDSGEDKENIKRLYNYAFSDVMKLTVAAEREVNKEHESLLRDIGYCLKIARKTAIGIESD